MRSKKFIPTRFGSIVLNIVLIFGECSRISPQTFVTIRDLSVSSDIITSFQIGVWGSDWGSKKASLTLICLLVFLFLKQENCSRVLMSLIKYLFWFSTLSSMINSFEVPVLSWISWLWSSFSLALSLRLEISLHNLINSFSRIL